MSCGAPKSESSALLFGAELCGAQSDSFSYALREAIVTAEAPFTVELSEAVARGSESEPAPKLHRKPGAEAIN